MPDDRMEVVSIVASVLLGIAFVVAGASKLAAREAWPTQAVGLGTPFFLVPYVPWVELAVGAALIVQVAKPIPQFAAIMLLLLFSALIAKRLSEGRRPPCACFGAWSAKPIGPEH
ncbi:MAG TPA: MauE/DoxX family redox-associated membrane protein, partial [Ilumatobacteraceae bacterium]|nr:MauE/DoxX family redox-associated membrane protein [Ilumatobacteraceae bacterium]